jgi:hypothetical protein
MCSRECYKAMYLRHFKSIHGARRSNGGSKYLERDETGEEIGVSDPWRDETT